MTNSNGHSTAGENAILIGEDVTSPTSPFQAVKVAVHFRPLIDSEILQGCKNCVTITPGLPQVQIGSCSYTYDHVYSDSATPSERIFEECVSPLVDGLFNGYNATVLAYGQTGSGKTHTMGIGCKMGANTDGIIPKVIDMLFKKMEMSEEMDYRVHASFVEILNEELHDLLICNDHTATQPNMYVGGMRSITPAKSCIQIRETSGGEITLSGATEIEVESPHHMSTLLEQGSLSRATASTNMNSHSSRSHAIIKITLQQCQKKNLLVDGIYDNFEGNCLHAKLHLVDLAGSERVRRTGADQLRFREGVHINKGLLALGNVISALGDDKKRKEGGYVPYRDSKLTRLLQDSLGGNSRTIMIACISPADSNAEESLNTLKYANRARNIQNKPIVNRNPMVSEVHELRQQLEMLQAELLCYRSGGSPQEIHTLKQRIAGLEADNVKLQQELEQARHGLQFCAQRVLDVFIERDGLRHKIDLLRSGKTWEEIHELDAYESCDLNDSVELLRSFTAKVQQLESHIHILENTKKQKCGPSLPSPYTDRVGNQVLENREWMVLNEDQSGDSEIISKGSEQDDVVAKEMEHSCLQVSMDKELQILNESLQQKEAEMTLMIKVNNLEMKQQYDKKVSELEEEKKILQMERDKLLVEIENLSCISDDQAQKMQETYTVRLSELESQLAELKRKQENQTSFLKQRLHNKDAEKHLLEEIRRMKFHRVQLQHRIKQESEYFRCWKVTREKELMQLKKEGRRNEHEMLKLQALNQRQKMVLQRKTEEAALATRRLKDILESHRSSSREMIGTSMIGEYQCKVNLMNQKALQQSVDNDIEIAVHIHEVRFNYEKQTELRASLAGELEKLQQKGLLPDSCTMDDINLTNPHARKIKIELLKRMLDTSSKAIVAMASELSEAEDRGRLFSGSSRWQTLRTMGDAKDLLNHIFNKALDYRCQLWDLNRENTELKQKKNKLKEMLKQIETNKKEACRQQSAELAITKAIRASSQINVDVPRKLGTEEVSFSLSHTRSPQRAHCLPPGGQPDMLETPMGGSQYECRKINTRVVRLKHHRAQGKILRWKRSQELSLLQFKWKWQKPWRLSEWIRHGDESFIREPARMLQVADSQWDSHNLR